MATDKLKIEPGVYEISNDVYHASEGISRSALAKLKESPLDYWQVYLSGEHISEKTKELVFGNAIHILALEPDIFSTEFAISKKVDGRTTAGKAYKMQFELDLNGRAAFDEDEFLKATEIVASIHNHSKFSVFMDGANIEKSVYWLDPDTNMLCKCRPDIWNNNLGIVCDIKTSANPRPADFHYSIKKYNYHIQAAMQIDGIFHATGKKIDYFYILAVPKEKPYKPYVYGLDKETIEWGRQEYKSALLLLKNCLEKDQWDLDRETVNLIQLSTFHTQSNAFNHLLEKYNVIATAS